MKTCFKCGKKKKLIEFYRHKMMSDGHLGKCKECTKHDVRMHRLNNLDAHRSRDRARAKLRSKETIRKNLEWAKRDRMADPRKDAARKKVARAIRDGLLKRKTRCVLCRRKTRIVAHHPDYDRPLDVVWLCDACHHKVHRDV